MLPVIILTGPTAVGKTEIAIETARLCNAEIISADSRQVYRRMDIGTAKPTLEERRSVIHHCIDIRDPDEPYNAGMFEKQAREITASLRKKGKNVIVTGGTGLYIRAYLYGLMPLEKDTSTEREKLQKALETQGVEVLYRELELRDAEYALKIHHTDARRIIRALEVIHATGKPLSYWHRQPHAKAGFPYVFIGLERQRDALYERINQRTEYMIKAGLVDEVRMLQEAGYAECKALETVGYAEILDYLRGKVHFEEAVERIKRNTRRYAKRQMTWFRKEQELRWLHISGKDIPHRIMDIARNLV